MRDIDPDSEENQAAQRQNDRKVFALQQQELCRLCNKPLAGEPWTDDDDYGSVHESCLENEEEQA